MAAGPRLPTRLTPTDGGPEVREASGRTPARRRRPIIRTGLVIVVLSASALIYFSSRDISRAPTRDVGQGADGTGSLPSPPAAAPGVLAAGTDQARPPFGDRASFVAWMLAHTDQKQSFLEARWDAAQAMVAIGYVHPGPILEAFLMTPREYFSRDQKRAYDDAALPIGYGQTISSPKLVTRMTEYLDLRAGQKVLEIGTGSGYQAALLSEITPHVYSIEIVGALAAKTNAIFGALGPRYPEFRGIRRMVADGYYGWARYAPFDRIIVTCGIDHIPPDLLRQLSPGGVMVIPVGPPSGQTILRVVKRINADGTVTFDRSDIFQGQMKEIFVPFTAAGGGRHAGGS
jgi:protein-L-isoaspartate(D-aspartate) O-methyltransferase